MSNWGLRLRRVVSGQFTVAVVGLVVLAALGGWVTYGTHVDSGTHVEQREVSSWSMTTDVSHEAMVTEPNPVYPVGTTLENRTVYFESVTPILNGTITYGYAASDEGNLTVTTDAWVTFQQVSRDRDGAIETEYWQTTEPLEQRRVTGVKPSDDVRLPFSINVSKLANRSERIEDELGRTSGETEALVHTDVTVNGTVNGQQVSRTDQYTLPVKIGSVYRVQDPGPSTEEYTTTESVTVENTSGPLQAAGAPLLLAGSLLGLSALVLARSQNRLALSPDERAYLDYLDDRSDFDEWINTISLADDTRSLPRAEAASLADLVDFAIDTDNSVIEDPDDGTYHVIHDGSQYVYVPPNPPTESSGPLSDPHPDPVIEESNTDTGSVEDPQATDD